MFNNILMQQLTQEAVHQDLTTKKEILALAKKNPDYKKLGKLEMELVVKAVLMVNVPNYHE